MLKSRNQGGTVPRCPPPPVPPPMCVLMCFTSRINPTFYRFVFIFFILLYYFLLFYIFYFLSAAAQLLQLSITISLLLLLSGLADTKTSCRLSAACLRPPLGVCYKVTRVPVSLSNSCDLQSPVTPTLTCRSLLTTERAAALDSFSNGLRWQTTILHSYNPFSGKVLDKWMPLLVAGGGFYPYEIVISNNFDI